MVLRAALLIVTLIGAMGATPSAAPACPTTTAEDQARRVATHFAGASTAALAGSLPAGRVRLVTEHSLSDEREDVTLPLEALDRHLAAVERAAGRSDPRGRHALEGLSCTGLVCRFGPSPILHNNLYLKEVGFVRRGACLAIRRLVVLDGD